MMAFLRAHGMDPGPLQRPLSAGGATGFVAAAPAIAVFASFGSLAVVADQIMQLPKFIVVLLLIGAFSLAGLIYGLIFRRAANDRRGGWLFGAVFGFVIWMAAPLAVLPLISGSVMAAGRAGTGFLACFLIWGTITGALFPYIHRLLQMRKVPQGQSKKSLGPGTEAVGARILRRVPRGWH